MRRNFILGNDISRHSSLAYQPTNCDLKSRHKTELSHTADAVPHYSVAQMLQTIILGDIPLTSFVNIKATTVSESLISVFEISLLPG